MGSDAKLAFEGNFLGLIFHRGNVQGKFLGEISYGKGNFLSMGTFAWDECVGECLGNFSR